MGSDTRRRPRFRRRRHAQGRWEGVHRRGTRGAEVRRLLGRRRRADQAGGRADRRRPQGRRRRGGRGLRDGRHHRRAARPGQPGQPAAAGPRAGHAAHRRRADLHGAAGHGHPQPGVRGPLVHRLAGRRDHHLGARPGPDHRRHPRPAARRALDEGAIAIVAGFQGVSPGHQGHHHAGPRRLGHHRRRARRGAAAPTSARSTPTSTASSPPTRGSCPTPGTSSTITYEEMLELAACGAKVLQLRCVEYARRYGVPIHVRSSYSTKHRHDGHRIDGGPFRGAGTDHRRRARPQRSQDHDRRGARRAGRRRAASSTRVADAEINIDMIVQNVSTEGTGRTDISFTLPKADGPTAMAALEQGPGARSSSRACSTTTTSARCR